MPLGALADALADRGAQVLTKRGGQIGVVGPPAQMSYRGSLIIVSSGLNSRMLPGRHAQYDDERAAALPVMVCGRGEGAKAGA